MAFEHKMEHLKCGFIPTFALSPIGEKLVKLLDPEGEDDGPLGFQIIVGHCLGLGTSDPAGSEIGSLDCSGQNLWVCMAKDKIYGKLSFELPLDQLRNTDRILTSIPNWTLDPESFEICR